ncbi:MAG: hypothetical protein AAB372_02840 [Patescibacteria group bacterium]
MRSVVGIDPDNHYGLALVRQVLQDPELRKRVFIIASRNDKFCTPRLCRVEDVPYHIVRTPRHISLLHEEEVCSVIAGDILDDIRALKRHVVSTVRLAS